MSALLAVALLVPCVALDGDTLRCGEERIRLIAIDAPELPGHCRRGRTCAPGDPFASHRALTAALRRGPLTIVRVRKGAWGRTDADVYVAGRSLSCTQLAGGHAIYWARYDYRQRIRAQCHLP